MSKVGVATGALAMYWSIGAPARILKPQCKAP
jgi:hypothetical protein